MTRIIPITEPGRLTTTEALLMAISLGYSISDNTCRKLGREHGLTVRMGRRVFFDKFGWQQLLLQGLPDRHSDVRPAQD
jgi:hypothetical protein